MYNRAPSNLHWTLPVDYVHRHNVAQPKAVDRAKSFGIRVTMPPEDPFRRLLGADWETYHWYATKEERDAAFAQMSMRHMYYRNSDDPSQVLEKITR